jgi:hypothetical protein
MKTSTSSNSLAQLKPYVDRFEEKGALALNLLNSHLKGDFDWLHRQMKEQRIVYVIVIGKTFNR